VRTLVILAGGYGTRLREVEPELPKGLVDLGGKTVLDIYAENFDFFDEVYISTNPKFEKYYGKWARGRAEVIVKPEYGEEISGNLETVLFSIETIGEREGYFFMPNDSYLDPARKFFEEFIREVERGYSPVIAVKKVRRKCIKGRFGNPVVEGGKVLRFVEKPETPVSDYAFMSSFYLPGRIGKKNTGALIKEFLDAHPHFRDSIGGFIQHLIDLGIDVRAYEYTGYWRDIGVPEDLEEVRRREKWLSRFRCSVRER